MKDNSKSGLSIIPKLEGNKLTITPNKEYYEANDIDMTPETLKRDFEEFKASMLKHMDESYYKVGEYLYINLFYISDIHTNTASYIDEDYYFLLFEETLEKLLKYQSLRIRDDILEMVYIGYTEDYEAYSEVIELKDFIQDDYFIRINLNELKEKENK